MSLTTTATKLSTDAQNHICTEFHAKHVRLAGNVLMLEYACICCGVNFESDMPEDSPLCELCFTDAGEVNAHSDGQCEPNCRYCAGSTECACQDPFDQPEPHTH